MSFIAKFLGWLFLIALLIPVAILIVATLIGALGVSMVAVLWVVAPIIVIVGGIILLAWLIFRKK